MKLRLLLLLTPLLLLSGCSFMFNYWVEAEYELPRCPSDGFDLPERVAAGKGLIVAGDSDIYCHGFSFFDVYAVPQDTNYFDISTPAWARMVMFARIDRGTKCRLQIIASAKCGFNTPKAVCRQETFPLVSETTIKETFQTAVDSLFFRSGTSAGRLADLRVVGFEDDLRKWCQGRAENAARVGGR